MAGRVVFTVSSFCGFAPSLGMLIALPRAARAGGGGLQPVSQAILSGQFPLSSWEWRSRCMEWSLYWRPAIGPTLGGWITDNFSWRWIFHMNIPVGILSLLLVSRLVEDPPYLTEQLKKARQSFSVDYVGIGLLALCLGALQVVLDKGQEDQLVRLAFHLDPRGSLSAWSASLYGS